MELPASARGGFGWPPTMTDPRAETRRVATWGSGRRGGWAVPGRAPRSQGRASAGTGQVIAGPSQTCCPAIQRFPDGGTTRSNSTALLR